VFVFFSFRLKAELQVFKLSFVRLSWGRTTDKLAINWQNFAQVGLPTQVCF